MHLTIDAQGLGKLQMKFAGMGMALASAIPSAMQQIGDEAESLLQVASPVGQNSGGKNIPPPGDAPGALRDSYRSQIIASMVDSSLSVTTTQPSKLYYVTHGRGWVFPGAMTGRAGGKKALYWQGLPHPVPWARPSTPNDFITAVQQTIRERAVLRIGAAVQKVLDEL
jgi:hypothetical protein